MEPLITCLFPFLFFFFQFQVAASSSSPLSSFSSSARPLCLHDQRSALLQFKHIFDINVTSSLECDDASIPKTLSWNENGTDCCEWDGVTCDGSTGHVIELDLNCSQLYGKIHPNSSLFQLSHLQWLNLAHNDFDYSSISHAFARFASLTHLNLSQSNFLGSVPSEISHLSKLMSLDLSCYKEALELEPLHFKIILTNLTQLQELILAGVNISSVSPDSLSNTSSLATLDLSNTGLQGHLPDSVFHLPNLQRLILYGNLNLDIILPKSNWGSASSIRELDLSSTNLSGELPDSIGHLKSLTWLDLSGCKLRGFIPQSLWNLTQIQQIYLANNNFLGGFPLWDAYSKQLVRQEVFNFTGLQFLQDLRLFGNNLSGVINPWLFTLPSLQYLDLSYNKLGFHPLSVSSLSNLTSPSNSSCLRELDLSYNSLSGVIPPWLFTLPSLTGLDMSSNHLTGQLPEFKHHLPLESIYLSHNKIRGPLPKSMSSTLVNLSYLDLSSNDLSGVVDLQIPQSIGWLDLSNNNLTIIARSNINSTLPNLWFIDMSSCNIEVFPYFLRASENLASLDLSQNRISGQIPKWFGLIGKGSLGYLNLSHNLLTDIKQLPWAGLWALDLNSNLLRGPLPVPPPSLQLFFISNNSLSGEIPLLTCNASFLQILDLSLNKLSGPVPQCLGNFSSGLSVLNLHSNGFTGTLHLAFAEANRLRSLDFSGNKFEGPLPRSLANCTSLEVLNVGNNKISDKFPYWLENLPELQVLVIRSNQFHGPIKTSKSRVSFPKLRIVDLSHNEFSGHLPERYFKYFQAMMNTTMPGKRYMGDEERTYYYDSVTVTMKGSDFLMQRILTIFSTMDFSSNKFSGDIPNVIGKLNSLIVLNISHNCLTGHIPESLGKLTSLESLDISSNQLIGRIPSLESLDLTFLQVLNLSWNHLDGRIPHGRQFDTFENGSYEGNFGLCGFPLSKECEHNRGKPPVVQEEEDERNVDGFFWKFVVIGYGCGMLLGLFLGSLMFLIGRPKFFVRLAEREIPRKVIRLRRMITDTVARRK